MPEVRYEGELFQYEIVRSPRRTICVEITREGKVVARAPDRSAAWAIDRFVRGRARWVLKHLPAARAVRKPRTYLSGEAFPYRGCDYRLRVVLDGARPHVGLDEEEIVVSMDAASAGGDAGRAAQLALSRWYREQASEVLPRRLSELSRQTGLRPARLTIRDQSSRWGSCSVKGSLNLNYKLVMAPPQVADYVMVHELCHLREQNHSKRFWSLVQSLVPDYKAHRKWLRENGPGLEV